MNDLSPKATAMIERVRHTFGPNPAARRRMRNAVLKRVSEERADPAGSEDGRGPGRGIFLASRTRAGILLPGLLVVLAGIVAVGRSAAPVQAVVAPHEEPRAALDSQATPREEPRVVLDSPAARAVAESPITASIRALPDARRARAKRSPPPRERATAERVPAPQAPGSAKIEPAGEVKPTDSLDAEMHLVREAQAALKAGDLEDARRALDAHARGYPEGVLREERLVLEVLLLCAEGRSDRARRAAGVLLRAHPRSSHLEPLRASCAGAAVRQ